MLLACTWNLFIRADSTLVNVHELSLDPLYLKLLTDCFKEKRLHQRNTRNIYIYTSNFVHHLARLHDTPYILNSKPED